MASLFISYSRQDLPLAEEMVQALAEQNLDTWVDWKSIPKGEDWWNEIARGIEEADIFLFLVSPDSVKSEICNREIGHAVLNNKRIIPIVLRDANMRDFVNEESRKEIARRNWIFCRKGQDDFSKAIQETLTVIHTDYEWVTYHTRLLLESAQWDRNDRERSFLLRGKELEEAERQLAANSSKEPLPTDLQREYVVISRQVSNRQQRITLGIAIAGVVVLAALAVIAFVQAAVARKQAAIALSRQLSAQAQTELLAQGDRRLSMLFALEAINTAKEVNGFENLAAEQVLRDAMYETGGEVLLSPVGGAVLTTRTGSAALTAVQALSPSGSWLAIAYQDHTVRLWDLNAPQKSPVILSASKQDTLNKLLFDPKERLLVGLKSEGGVEIWDLNNPTRESRVFSLVLGPMPLSDYSGDPTFSPDGHWLALHCIRGSQGPYTAVLDLTNLNAKPLEIPGNYRVAPGLQGHWLLTVEQNQNGIFSAGLWDLNDLARAPISLSEEFYCLNFIVSPDARWLATNCDNAVWIWDIQDPLNPQRRFGPLPNTSIGTFSADSRHIAVIDLLGRVVVLDLLDGKDGSPIYFSGQDKSLRNLRFSADGQMLAATSGATSTLVWVLSSHASFPLTLNGVGGIESAAQDFAFTSDGRHVISLSDDGVARKWDLWNPYADSFLPGANPHGIPYLDAISFSPDGRWLALVDESQSNSNPYYALVDLQNLFSDPIRLPISDGPLFFNAAGDQVISVSQQENKIQSWNTADLVAGNLHPTSFGLPGRIIASHVADRWLVTQLEDNAVQVFDLFQPEAQPKSVMMQKALTDPLTVMTNGKWLWLAGEDNVFQLWDLDHPDQQPESVSSLAAGTEFKISPAGNWMASADHDFAQLWNLKKSPPEVVASVEADKGFGINGDEVFAFSPDEHWLIVSQGNKVQLLNLENPNAEPVTLAGMVEEIHRLAFSSDSDRLAASGVGNEIRIWNIQNLTSAPVVLRQDESAQALRFSPDGKWLAAVELSKLELRRLDIDELSTLACEIIGSNLSQQQWKENFPAKKAYEKTCPRRPDGQDKNVQITTG